MPCYYDSKKIEPGFFATINKEVVRSEDGTSRKINYSLTAKGKISADRGSPDSTGAFWTGSGYAPVENIPAISRLASIRNKQGALMNLFCNDYRLLEIQPFDGTAPIKAVVKLRSITFEEGKWFDYCDYTIQFEAAKIWFGGFEICSGGTVQSTPPEESWTIEQADDKGRTYRIQHNVTASAKNDYFENGTIKKLGWEIARDIILDVNFPSLGLDPKVYSDPNAEILNMLGYNYVRGQQIDEANGKYSVTESWLMYDASLTSGIPCLEEYNINVRTSQDGRTSVSIEGNLTGLEVRNNITHALVSTRKDNVDARWAALEPQLQTICSSNSGITINPVALNKSVGKNPMNGTITFSREYDNRPVVFSGAISATVQVNDSKPTDIFASLVVLGKPEGPVLQSIGTVTAKRRSLSIEIVMPAATMTTPAPTKPNSDTLVSANDPGLGFKDRDEESWSAQTGRYSRQVNWTWV